MSCDERRDSMLLYAAGQLDGAEAGELLAHLDLGCPRCTGSLAEAHAVLAQLPLGLEPVTPPPAVRQKLMARVASRARRPGWESWVRPALAAGLASLLTYVAAGKVFERRAEREIVERTEVLEQQNARQDAEIRRLEGEISSATRTVRLLSSPNLLLVRLGGTEAQPDASGRIFWDRDQNAWHFFASNLKPQAKGRTYELWFITADQRKVPAGTFDVEASGEGTLYVKVPEGIGPLALAAVTDEPEGGSAQPTGSIHLAGPIEASKSVS